MLGYQPPQLMSMLEAKSGVLLVASDKLAAKWATLQALAGAGLQWVAVVLSVAACGGGAVACLFKRGWGS